MRPASPTSLPPAFAAEDGATLLYVIGAQKAGTSWLYETLEGSAGVLVQPIKETHYFDVLYVPGEEFHLQRRIAKAALKVEGLKRFRNRRLARELGKVRQLLDLIDLFAGEPEDHSLYLHWISRGWTGQKVIADVTPAYALLKRDDFARMAGLAPRTRFLFLMRDPVDRFWSYVRMNLDDKGVTDTVFAQNCAKRVADFCSRKTGSGEGRSNYVDTISELEAAVPASDISYIFFEDLFRPETMDTLSGSLGLGPLTANFEKPRNIGRSLSLTPDQARALYGRLEQQYSVIAERFGSRLPERWQARMREFGKTDARGTAA